MADPVLRSETSDGVTTLTLNRPEAMNALSRALRVALADAFRAAASDAATAVVILTGAGDRAFCAGLDLKELGGETSESGGTEEAVAGGYDLIQAMEGCPKPILGAINGVAITGGFELALACDVLVGAPQARFADTHARVGIMPGWGLSQKLSRLVGIHRAKELSLTGNFLEADRAVDWGLLNRVVPADALLPTCRKLASDMQSCVRPVMQAYKRVIDAGFAATYAEGRRLESQAAHENSGVDAETISQRRKAVQERGRAQQG